jgi:hypothetical protein
MTYAPTEHDVAEVADLGEFMPASVEVSNDLPDFRDIPTKAQHILSLRALGWSISAIASTFEITPPSIHSCLDRYDPDRRLSFTPEQRKAFISKLWESRVSEALFHITPEKLKAAPARDLAHIARIGTDAISDLSPSDEARKGLGADLLKQLRKVAALPARESTESL